MPSNTQTDLTGNPIQRRYVDLTKARGGGLFVETAKPWAITIAAAIVSFADCVYYRGGLAKTTTPGLYTVAGADGFTFIGAAINLEDGTSEIIEGASLADVTHETEPEDTTLMRVPLYKLKKVTVNDNVSLSVVLDYRYMPHLPVYI